MAFFPASEVGMTVSTINAHEAETQRSPLKSFWKHLKHEVSFGADMGGN